MCTNCEILKAAFAGAKSEPHLNYLPIHSLIMAMLKQRRLELYAGDCPFDKMTEILESETHYTVCFYFKCPECDTFYFFGACIRGEPIYKVINDISAEEPGKMLWGTEGTWFSPGFRRSDYE